MKGAMRCEVTACELRNVGTAVYLGDDTHRCRVAGNDITQTLRDGIKKHLSCQVQVAVCKRQHVCEWPFRWRIPKFRLPPLNIVLHR